MPPTIYLARHGQTEYNRDKKILGLMDAPLTPRGLEGAKALAENLDGRRFDRALASPLGRAAATARLITDRLGLDLELRPELTELSSGLWEGLSREEAIGEAAVLRPDWDSRPPQGESYLDGEKRLAPFIEELRGLSGTILMVGHFAINRSFLKAWRNLSIEEALKIDVLHEAIYILDGGPNGGTVRWLDARGRQGEGFFPWPSQGRL